MKIEFVNDINYLLEATLYLEQRFAGKDNRNQIIKSLIDYGVARDKVMKLFANYQKLINALAKEEINIDHELIPYFKVGEFKHSLATNIYLYVMNNSDHMLETNINDFFSNLISSYLQEDLVINNIEDLIRLLNLTDFSNEAKIIWLSFYANGQSYYQRIIELLKITSRIIFKYNYLIKEEALKNFSVVSEHLQEYLLLKDLTENDTVRVQPSIFAFDEISLTNRKKDKYLCYGYLFFVLIDLKEQSSNDENLVINTLKALGDRTRFRIVSILQNKKLYLQELSRMVELTPATVSYHLDYLKKYNIIEIDEVSFNTNKIYYRLNPAIFNKLIYYFNNLIKGN